MVRKIPVRKHRGVNDPEDQKRKREAKLKNIINNPPTSNEDDEPLPKSLQEIIRLKQMVKEGKFDTKKKRKHRKKKNIPLNVEGRPLLHSGQFIGPVDYQQTGMKRPEKSIPTIQQRPGERDKTFLYRLNQLCDEVIKETKFEKKYNVDVVRNPETGQVESLKKKPKDEVDEMLKEEAKKAKEAADPKKRKKSKKKEEEKAAARAEKIQKRKDRRKLKREKILQKSLQKKEATGSNIIRENVRFGEVADRPPELKVRPRKALDVGDKDLKTLMFNQMLIQGKKAEQEKLEKSKKVIKKPIKPSNGKSMLSGKRKELPIGQRRMLEEQQKSAIAAYRLMKAKKGTQVPPST